MSNELDLFGNEIAEVKPITREVLAECLYENLSILSLDEFVLLFTNKFTEIIEYAELLNGGDCCKKTSLLFNPHRLDTKSLTSKQSIYAALKDKSFISGLARACLFKYGKVNELLYQAICLCVNGVQYINEFPPAKCRDVMKQYNINKNSFVLDPCGGWGGRMLGTSAVCNNYVCFEPSTKTHLGLNKLSDFIKTMNTEFNPKINCLPFEESELKENFFDIAMTSPPYYDTEEYSNEPTNSMNKYKTFDEWSEKFYLPLIQKTLNALKNGAPFILNIGNRTYPLDKVLLDNFGKKYKITRIDNFLARSGGIRKIEFGEMFFEIKK